MAGRKYEQDRSKVHKQSINFAVSEREKGRIIQEAEKMGMSMSGYIRYRLFIKEAKLMFIPQFWLGVAATIGFGILLLIGYSIFRKK